MDVRVAVAYHSGYGKTGSLARAVARGAASVDGASVELLDVTRLDDAGWDALDDADAIIFGSPTYFGSISSDMKRFLEGHGRPLGRRPALKGQAGGRLHELEDDVG